MTKMATRMTKDSKDMTTQLQQHDNKIKMTKHDKSNGNKMTTKRQQDDTVIILRFPVSPGKII